MIYDDDGYLLVKNENNIPKQFEGYIIFDDDKTPYFTYLDNDAPNGRIIQHIDL